MQSADFRIALVGRTNVGKSTLFNRLSGTRGALVFDRPGVTRDVKECVIDVWGRPAVLLDVPGMFDYAECDNDPELMSAINAKLRDVLATSDLLVFVLDGVVGVTPNDAEIARLLRKSGKDVVVVVNKSEKKSAAFAYSDAVSFGFADTIEISAEHGLGIDDLLALLQARIPENSFNEPGIADDAIKLAIVGRPNVGKSTIVNKLLGEEKQLVADFAGVTRESASSYFEFAGRKIQLVDTPGIRRKSRVIDVLEKISVSNARNSYRKADAVILVIDASTLIAGEIEKQDLTLAADIVKCGKALVIAFNKYDKTPYAQNDVPEFLKRNFAKSFSQLKDVPFLFTSALNSRNINKMMRLAIETYDKQSRKFKTSELNDWLAWINQSSFLQSGSAKFRLKYITQVGSVPPTFLIFVSNKKNMRADHERFIANNLKEHFKLKNIVVNVLFREQSRKKN
ncbi:MAG: ribosome biogenesis GTPase Der [Alphaproteobacteria bacterium]|nr:ribosome biogenesis GTPase Der [Alphaproteobacteria bacterium]